MTFRPARLASLLAVTAGAAALLWSAGPALAAADWNVSPTSLDFGMTTAAVHTSGPTRTFTITNTNSDPQKYYVLVDITQAARKATIRGVLGIGLPLQASGSRPRARCQGLPKAVYQTAPTSQPASPAARITMMGLCMRSSPLFSAG